jgi:hypothetical protein
MAAYGAGRSAWRTTLVAVRTRDTLFIAPGFLPVALPPGWSIATMANFANLSSEGVDRSGGSGESRGQESRLRRLFAPAPGHRVSPRQGKKRVYEHLWFTFPLGLYNQLFPILLIVNWLTESK